MNLNEESLAHWQDTIEHLNTKLIYGVYPNQHLGRQVLLVRGLQHLGRQVLLVRGLPNEVTIYIDDPTIGDGYTARLSH